MRSVRMRQNRFRDGISPARGCFVGEPGVFISFEESTPELEVVDIYQNPKLEKGEQIIAAPTLIKKLPLPLRRVIGDMSDTEKFLVGIDLKSKQAGE